MINPCPQCNGKGTLVAVAEEVQGAQTIYRLCCPECNWESRSFCASTLQALDEGGDLRRELRRA